MATDTAAAVDTHDDHHGPTPREYVQIAGVLFVLTALEFSTYFIDFEFMAVPILLGLMAIKFVMVAGFFMHLKFDTKLYNRLMTTGLLLALGLYAITLAAIQEIPRNVGF